ncbi:MAG: hypothetical protein RBG13Loki_1685 [Promethearchaeota archaeon CR_4]|nr:MAG: hypothetical protein RBG13Loki_1685 [Candidatus Lokiarchaeota archaeon CR_4]
MELENLTKKEMVKRALNDESNENLNQPYDPPIRNSARGRIPDVFDHQYVEYISGLKPPYTKYGLLGEKKTKIKDE